MRETLLFPFQSPNGRENVNWNFYVVQYTYEKYGTLHNGTHCWRMTEQSDALHLTCSLHLPRVKYKQKCVWFSLESIQYSGGVSCSLAPHFCFWLMSSVGSLSTNDSQPLTIWWWWPQSASSSWSSARYSAGTQDAIIAWIPCTKHIDAQLLHHHIVSLSSQCLRLYFISFHSQVLAKACHWFLKGLVTSTIRIFLLSSLVMTRQCPVSVGCCRLGPCGFCPYWYQDDWDQPVLYGIVAKLPYSCVRFAATWDMEQRLVLKVAAPAPRPSCHGRCCYGNSWSKLNRWSTCL